YPSNLVLTIILTSFFFLSSPSISYSSTPSLHDALPIFGYSNEIDIALISVPELSGLTPFPLEKEDASKVGEEVIALGTPLGFEKDRKSTRLNSSHVSISYAVFCLKKKK